MERQGKLLSSAITRKVCLDLVERDRLSGERARYTFRAIAERHGCSRHVVARMARRESYIAAVMEYYR